MTQSGDRGPRAPGESSTDNGVRRVVGALVLLVLAVGGGVTIFAWLRGTAEAPSSAPLVTSGTAPGVSSPQGLGPVSGPDSTPLPDARLARLDGGGEIDTSSYRGRPLVVNLWATWCGPCKREMPDFQRVADDLAAHVAFLGIDVQDDLDEARRFADDLGITYDLAVDPRAQYYGRLGAIGMPTTLFVDADGVVRYRQTGALDEAGLRAALAEHLGVPARPPEG